VPIYEYSCRKCLGRFEHLSLRPHEILTEACPRCGELGDRVYSVTQMKVFHPFTTKNILPGGSPVTVKGPGQLRQLEAEHHVRMMDADAPPPQTIPTIGGGD